MRDLGAEVLAVSVDDVEKNRDVVEKAKLEAERQTIANILRDNDNRRAEAGRQTTLAVALTVVAAVLIPLGILGIVETVNTNKNRCGPAC